MDKNLYNFSVTWHNQKEQYVGFCAEFSFLSYLADTDLEAYQGILSLVCGFEEQIEQFQQKEEFDKWFAANAPKVMDDSQPAIPHSQVLAEVRAFVELRARRNKVRLKLQATRILSAI